MFRNPFSFQMVNWLHPHSTEDEEKNATYFHSRKKNYIEIHAECRCLKLPQLFYLCESNALLLKSEKKRLCLVRNSFCCYFVSFVLLSIRSNACFEAYLNRLSKCIMSKKKNLPKSCNLLCVFGSTSFFLLLIYDAVAHNANILH